MITVSILAAADAAARVSRAEMFAQLDRPAPKPLPAEPSSTPSSACGACRSTTMSTSTGMTTPEVLPDLVLLVLVAVGDDEHRLPAEQLQVDRPVGADRPRLERGVVVVLR